MDMRKCRDSFDYRILTGYSTNLVYLKRKSYFRCSSKYNYYFSGESINHIIVSYSAAHFAVLFIFYRLLKLQNSIDSACFWEMPFISECQTIIYFRLVWCNVEKCYRKANKQTILNVLVLTVRCKTDRHNPGTTDVVESGRISLMQQILQNSNDKSTINLNMACKKYHPYNFRLLFPGGKPQKLSEIEKNTGSTCK